MNVIITVILSLSVLVQNLPSETLRFGVPELKIHTNFLNDNSAASYIVKQSATQPFFSKISSHSTMNLHLIPILGDEILQDCNGSCWKAKVSNNLFFSNGWKLTARDVKFSLDRCLDLQRSCPIKVQLDQNEEIIISSTNLDDISENSKIADYISRCPILEADTSKIFGNLLGNGTNLVGTGAYLITKHNPGKKITLSKNPYFASNSEIADQIEITKYDNFDKALKNIRNGGLDYILSKIDNLPDAVSADETLSSIKCGEFNVIKRKSNQLVCNPNMNVNTLRYD